MHAHFFDYCNSRAEEENRKRVTQGKKRKEKKLESYLSVVINLCQPHWTGTIDVTTDLKDSRLGNLFSPRTVLIGSECPLQKERRKTFSMHGRGAILIFLENRREWNDFLMALSLWNTPASVALLPKCPVGEFTYSTILSFL